MGCWNESCAISGLPILQGDDVKLIVLAENYWNATSCTDVNTFFIPYGFAFDGTYNDYGGIDINTEVEKSAELTLSLVKSELVELEQGENKYHDILVKKEGFDLEKLMEASHENRLFLRNPHKGARNAISSDRQSWVVMIRKEIFEGIVTGYNPEVYAEIDNVESENNREKIWGYIPLNEMLSREFNDWLIKATEKSFGEYAILLADKPMHIRCEQPGQGLEDRHLFNMLQESIKTPTQFRALQGKIIEMIKLQCFMDETRRSWVPPAGKGSQNSETDCHKLLVNLMNKSIKQIKKRWED